MIIFVITIIFISTSIQFSYAEQYHVIIPPEASTTTSIFHFIPSDFEIQVLDTVIWQNMDSVVHTVTSGTFGTGPDGLFNSGPIEPGDSFSFQFEWEDIGIVTYFCTIHPWMNSIILVVDETGVMESKAPASGSMGIAQQKIQQAEDLLELIPKMVKLEEYANTYHQIAKHYHDAAAQFVLLEDNQNAAKYYQESAKNYHNSALSFHELDKIQDSLKHHYLSGVEHHNSALQFFAINDYTNYEKQFTESLVHKRMAKYGSEYVLPPKPQMVLVDDPTEISCKKGMELIIKLSNDEPKCLSPTSAEKLVQRGWAKR